MSGLKRFAFVAAAAIAASSTIVSAATLTQYTFETSIPTTAGPFAAEVGTGSGSSTTGGTFTSPSGNGSLHSYSSNSWDVGDYFQFTADMTGASSFQLQFDAAGSNTGPRDFKVQYSTTGTGGTFTDLPGGTYTLALSTFTPGTELTTTPPRYSFNLSSITALNNNANDVFRLVNTTTTSIGGATTAAGGTSRVDNVTIGTAPEPTMTGVLGLAGIAAFRRRRQTSSR